MADSTPEWAVETVGSRTLRATPDRDWLGRPVMAARPDGTWMLTYREAPYHDLHTDSAVHIAFSGDGGETWSDDTTLGGVLIKGFPHTRPAGEVGGGTMKYHGDDLYVATYGGHTFNGPTDIGYRLREDGESA
jgi:hypothetical protein